MREPVIGLTSAGVKVGSCPKRVPEDTTWSTDGWLELQDLPWELRCFGSQVFRASEIFVETQAGDLSMAARVSALSSGGAASRRRERRLRRFWRHEQCSIKMALACAKHHSWQSRESVGVQTDAAPTLVDEYVAPAAAPCAATADITQLLEPPIPDKFVTPVSADTYTEPSSTTLYVAPAPSISYTTPAPEIEHMPAPVIEYIALPPTVFYPSFSQQLPPANEAVTGLVKPQISISAVEASQVVGLFKLLFRTFTSFRLWGGYRNKLWRPSK